MAQPDPIAEDTSRDPDQQDSGSTPTEGLKAQQETHGDEAKVAQFTSHSPFCCDFPILPSQPFPSGLRPSYPALLPSAITGLCPALLPSAIAGPKSPEWLCAAVSWTPDYRKQQLVQADLDKSGPSQELSGGPEESLNN